MEAEREEKSVCRVAPKGSAHEEAPLPPSLVEEPKEAPIGDPVEPLTLTLMSEAREAADKRQKILELDGRLSHGLWLIAELEETRDLVARLIHKANSNTDKVHSLVKDLGLQDAPLKWRDYLVRVGEDYCDYVDLEELRRAEESAIQL